MSRLVCFGSDQIDWIWPAVKEHIQLALNQGSDYTLEQIKEGLQKAEMQLWTSYNHGYEAALVTALHDDYCLLLACGGTNAREWIEWYPIVEKWAKSKGAKEFRIYGRRGWLRMLEGFSEKYTVLTRTI